MKFFFLASFILASAAANAAIVNSARLSASGKSVIVNLTYGGGCREHTFKLKLNDVCLESYPAQCSADVVETIVGGFDMCEAIITKEVSFNIKKTGLSRMTYWTFLGDVGSTGQRSSATLLIE